MEGGERDLGTGEGVLERTRPTELRLRRTRGHDCQSREGVGILPGPWLAPWPPCWGAGGQTRYAAETRPCSVPPGPEGGRHPTLKTRGPCSCEPSPGSHHLLRPLSCSLGSEEPQLADGLGSVSQCPPPRPLRCRWNQRLDFLMTQELSNRPEQGRRQPCEAMCKIDISTSLITY